MRLTIIAILVIAAINSARSDVDDNPKELYENINAKYLRGYLKQRQALENLTAKVEAACPGKGDDFEESIIKMKQCVDQIEESQETVCSVIKNHFLRCTKPMVKVFEDCFPSNSKDIPSFIFKSLASATNYVCKADGEHILELMNPCVMKPNYRLSRCERKIKAKLQQYKTKIPTKTEICDFVQSFKPCLQMHLNNSCGHHVTRESVLGLYEAIFVACDDINSVDHTLNLNTEVEFL